jgi:hypothetical protein
MQSTIKTIHAALTRMDDDLLAETKRRIEKRNEGMPAGEHDVLLADLRQLTDEHSLAFDVPACDYLFDNKADAFHLGVVLGERMPTRKSDPSPITESGRTVEQPPN